MHKQPRILPFKKKWRIFWVFATISAITIRVLFCNSHDQFDMVAIALKPRGFSKKNGKQTIWPLSILLNIPHPSFSFPKCWSRMLPLPHYLPFHQPLLSSNDNCSCIICHEQRTAFYLDLLLASNFPCFSPLHPYAIFKPSPALSTNRLKLPNPH